MPYSHHSHSGSYCKHAHDTLESVVSTAIDKRFNTYCLTEHAPRLSNKLLYPEEEELGMTVSSLFEQFDSFVKHARDIQHRVNEDCSSKTKILVGYESEGGIDSEHLEMCLKLQKDMDADVTVGSVHHVNGIDIDFDQKSWDNAYEEYGGLRGLYLEYYNLVYRMIETLKPSVIAHFDLIRLFANTEIEKDGRLVKITYEEKLNVDIKRDWPDVWRIISNCIDLIIKNNLTVELNSAAIRKGWTTPYPKDDILMEMISKNVKFVMSDDSHGNDQVGLNFQYVLEYIREMGIRTIWYYDLEEVGNPDVRNGIGKVVLKNVKCEELIENEFWRTNYPSICLEK